MPFDLDRLEAVGSAVPVIEKVRVSSEAAADWTVSANGTVVYRTGTLRLPTHGIAWLSDGRQSPLWEQQQTYAEPRLSPDGTKLTVI